MVTKIYSIRKELSMSRNDLSKKTGIKVVRITRLEMDDSVDLKRSEVKALCKALGKRPFSLFVQTPYGLKLRARAFAPRERD